MFGSTPFSFVDSRSANFLRFASYRPLVAVGSIDCCRDPGFECPTVISGLERRLDVATEASLSRERDRERELSRSLRLRLRLCSSGVEDRGAELLGRDCMEGCGLGVASGTVLSCETGLDASTRPSAPTGRICLRRDSISAST